MNQVVFKRQKCLTKHLARSLLLCFQGKIQGFDVIQQCNPDQDFGHVARCSNAKASTRNKSTAQVTVAPSGSRTVFSLWLQARGLVSQDNHKWINAKAPDVYPNLDYSGILVLRHIRYSTKNGTAQRLPDWPKSPRSFKNKDGIGAMGLAISKTACILKSRIKPVANGTRTGNSASGS